MLAILFIGIIAKAIPTSFWTGTVLKILSELFNTLVVSIIIFAAKSVFQKNNNSPSTD
jgi:hypothetical protein